MNKAKAIAIVADAEDLCLGVKRFPNVRAVDVAECRVDERDERRVLDGDNCFRSTDGEIAQIGKRAALKRDIRRTRNPPNYRTRSEDAVDEINTGGVDDEFQRILIFKTHPIEPNMSAISDNDRCCLFNRIGRVRKRHGTIVEALYIPLSDWCCCWSKCWRQSGR